MKDRIFCLQLERPCQNNQLKTSVCRRPTLSAVYTHYESYFDQSYRKSLIFTLLSRCYSICLDYTLFHLEVEKLREIFKKNRYLSGIIEPSIRPFQNRLYVPSMSNSSEKRATNNFTLSWNHVIKFKAKTANFHSTFITTM